VRVLLDASALPADRGGVGRYVDNLVAALVAECVDVIVACQQRDVALFGALGAQPCPLPKAAERRPVRLAWEQTGLSALARRVGAAVVHCPHYTMPLVSRPPVVVTQHDATFFSNPGVHIPVKARFFRSASRIALRRAASCVVPSAATRDELLRLAGPVRAEVEVVPHGVDHTVFRPPSTEEKAAAAARIGVGPGGYLAFLGTIEPRKNVPALIRGWVEACSGFADPPALVLAGAPGWDREVDDAAAAVPARLRLVRTGYLPIDELPMLLGGATLVTYPSLGEGFGLPVLEAMACGVAVLTTKRLAIPEVGGGAVAYCGTGAGEIAAALRLLLGDPARRARLGVAARERAAGFSWRASAQAHLAVYERAAIRAPCGRPRASRRPSSPS
jgi:glycosyltransferase involved in cell wall biosynthesis